MPLTPGTRLGRYEVIRLLGAGGAGEGGGGGGAVMRQHERPFPFQGVPHNTSWAAGGRYTRTRGKFN